jgi:predicted RNA-binding Zn-ribbon protein involved in translation (DUF1610 family)
MNFKPALCPSCGGKMQVPDDANTIKCMYCGVEVIVKEAIRLAGRVKEYTQASAIEKVIEPPKPFDFDAARNRNITVLLVWGVIAFVVGLCIGGSALIYIMIGYAVLVAIIFALNVSNTNKIKKAIAESEAKEATPQIQIVGYEGQCPYCDTSIKLKANVLGDNCPACQKRIVLRDSKFYSVDTPVGGLDRKSL